ncbi:MAG TPA: class I SAM-dependent methyltransferase [Candidatus Limnocylindria bacterium]|nr:class I SAM-dependent methyltransferase [Candidatus Limnocylindria bacterium]
MVTEEERIAAEIAHGKFIHEHHPELWDWSTPAGRLRLRRRAGLLCEYGRFRRGERLLEIGCGTGLVTELVHAATGATIVGTDISEELVTEARQRVPDVTFQVDNALRLSFPDGSFDAVYGSSILHHLEVDRALVEILRVLRPGGRTVFAEPNMLNPQIFVQKNVPLIKRWLGDTPHETAFVRWSVGSRLRRLGFTDVVAFPFDFLHPLTPEALIPLVASAGALAERLPIVREIAGSCLILARKPGSAAGVSTHGE